MTCQNIKTWQLFLFKTPAMICKCLNGWHYYISNEVGVCRAWEGTMHIEAESKEGEIAFKIVSNK